MTPASTLMPFNESLLLGAILQYMCFVIDVDTPVGILVIVFGCSIVDVDDVMSYPMDPLVLCVGILACLCSGLN